MDISQFNSHIIEEMREEILKVQGNEVFFVALTGNDHSINEVRVIARGNDSQVPVIYDEAFKGDYVIHNHPSGLLDPSDDDLTIASTLGNEGIGFIIVNNTVTKAYTVVEGVEPNDRSFLDPHKLSSLIDEEGEIARHFDPFEKRDSQIKMLERIVEAFNGDEIAVIEAGTGVGKSMAYLIPAIHWSVKNKEKVVISTNTINLQEQLIKKDIPFLQKALGIDFKAVLIKGRSNYICLRKLYSAKEDLENDLFNESEQNWLEAVQKSVTTLKEGSKDEVAGIMPLEAWDKIASETDTCLKTKCSYHSRCFFFKARKEVQQANLLIVNHHLLCSDLAIKGEIGDSSNSYGLLPPYQKIIIDEAHNLEHVAVNYFGYSVSPFSFRQSLSRLYHLKGSSEKGILGFLKREINGWKGKGDNEIIDAIDEILTDKVIPDIMRLNHLVDSFFQLMLSFALDQMDGNLENKLRVTPDSISSSIRDKIEKESQALIQGTQNIYGRIKELLEKLHKIPLRIKEKNIGMIKNLEAYHSRLLSALTSLDIFVHFKEEDSVYWIEVKKRDHTPWLRLNVSPLNVSEFLNDFLFTSHESVILTSATLTTDGSFNFLKQELGLNLTAQERITEALLPSPFDYMEQMSICIPTDLPSPQDKNFTKSVNEFLVEIIEITKGKTFILFTSYGMLNQAYDHLDGHFSHRITLLKQGSMDRHTLIDRFKNGNHTVLLGTDSFWEGVDVPGKSLSCVILVKLPFKVPTEPITQGKVEKLEREGKNPFYDYSLPLSVIKFRQGFGRLIRTAEDEGVVICLDKRIITKSYGKMFINALPLCHQVIGDQMEVLDGVSKYFKNSLQT